MKSTTQFKVRCSSYFWSMWQFDSNNQSSRRNCIRFRFDGGVMKRAVKWMLTSVNRRQAQKVQSGQHRQRKVQWRWRRPSTVKVYKEESHAIGLLSIQIERYVNNFGHVQPLRLIDVILFQSYSNPFLVIFIW